MVGIGLSSTGYFDETRLDAALSVWWEVKRGLESGAKRLSEEMKDVVPLDDESLRCLAEAYYAICDRQLQRIVIRDRVHARQTKLQVSEKSLYQ